MAESGMYVYVSHQGGNQISVLRMSPATGELNKVQDVSVTGKAMPMAVSPDRRFLFVGAAHRAVLDRELRDRRRERDADPPRERARGRERALHLHRSHGQVPARRLQPGGGAARRTGWISVSAIGPHGYVQAPHQVIRTPPKTHSILPDPVQSFRVRGELRRRRDGALCVRRCDRAVRSGSAAAGARAARNRDRATSCSIRTIASCIC